MAVELKTHQVGQAGEHLVAAELHRRGAYAVTFSGNMPDIDVLASNVDRSPHRLDPSPARDNLARHGGQRARNPDSTHHAAPVSAIEEWRERWDVLRVF